MSLPASFLIGVAAILVYQMVAEPLPGQADLSATWPFLLLIPVPWLLARLTARRVHELLLRRGALPSLAGVTLRVPGLAVPMLFALLVFAGEYPDVIAELAPGSQLVQHTLLLAPLVVMEVSVRLAERRTVRWLEAAHVAGAGTLGPTRLPMTFFVLAPIILFSGLTDLAFQDRRVEVFFSTSLGSSIGIVITIVALCFALPLFFRWTLPTTPKLPHQLADEIKATARALDFPENRILKLETNHRVVNAAMVGPLPWLRYLVLSDGILSLLDRSSLRGVVAHEIGHARANHPALLLLGFVVIPVLLLHPLLMVDWKSWDPTIIAIGGGIILLLILVALRTIAHRFEMEADQLSAQALGGSRPCVDALRRVSELYPGYRYKSSFRHPSEVERIRHLEAWEHDAEYRALHRRRSARLRVALLAAAAIALITSGIVHARMWARDHAVYLLYSGDFGAARDRLQSIEADPPLVVDDELAILRAEAEAAVELVGAGGPGEWYAYNEELAQRAWDRGVETMLTEGTVAARPWLGLALSGNDTPAAWRTLHLYAAAIENEDVERAVRLASHLIQLGVEERIDAHVGRETEDLLRGQ